MLSVINFILGALGLLCSLGIMIGFLGLIISLIVEATKQVPEGEKRSLKWTKTFGFTFAGSFILMIVVLILWGIAVFTLNTL